MEKEVIVTANKPRNSSIELARVIAMLMIVLSHTYTCAMDAWNWTEGGGVCASDDNAIATLFASFFYFGVNMFLLLSGYFLIKPSVKKFAMLYVVVAFYTLLGVLFNYFYNGEGTALTMMLTTLFPFGKSSSYWFVECYVYLFLISPLLNVALEKLPRQQVLIGLFCVGILDVYFGWIWQRTLVNGSGYCFVHFIFMYLLGRTIFFYRQEISRVKPIAWYCLLLWIICSLGLFLMFYESKDVSAFVLRTHCHSNPLSIIGSVALFLPFTQFNFHSRFVNLMAGCTFGVYLAQGNRYIIYTMYDALSSLCIGHYGLTLLIGFALFIIGILTDYVLQWVYKPIQKGVSRIIDIIQKRICVKM